MGGRPLKLVAEKQLIGRGPGLDAAGRPLNSGPGFKRINPRKPNDLTPLASEWWDRVVPGMVAADIVSQEFEPTLIMAAECWSRYAEAQDIVAREGILLVTDSGVVRHPAARAAADESRAYLGFARVLGLSPADVQRVGAPPTADIDDNPFA